MPPLRPDITTDIAALQRRVQQLEAQAQAPYQEYRDTAGRLRVRVGVQADGAWGLRVWNTSGALIVDQTAA